MGKDTTRQERQKELIETIDNICDGEVSEVLTSGDGIMKAMYKEYIVYINEKLENWYNPVEPFTLYYDIETDVSVTQLDIIEGIKEYIKQTTEYSYLDLTDYLENTRNPKIPWGCLHNFRDSLYKLAGGIINTKLDSKNQTPHKIWNDYGAASRGSDIDIAITEHWKDSLCIFVCTFAVFTNKYLSIGPDKYVKPVEKEDENYKNYETYVEEIYECYLKTFSDLFDIIGYTASGMITIPAKISGSVDATHAYKKILKEIKINKDGSKTYQVIHVNSCPDQHTMFKFTTLMLLKDEYLPDGTDESDTIISRLEKIPKVKEKYDKFVEVSTITKKPRSVRYAKLALQLGYINCSTNIYNYIKDHIRDHLGDMDDNTPEAQKKIIKQDEATEFSNFCKIMSKWEYICVLVNSVTPESAKAIQTFVTSVLWGQQKLIYELEMQNDSLWIALLENYMSMAHHYKGVDEGNGDIRKAYKYMMRSINLIYLITGETKGFLCRHTKSVVYEYECPLDLSIPDTTSGTVSDTQTRITSDEEYKYSLPKSTHDKRTDNTIDFRDALNIKINNLGKYMTSTNEKLLRINASTDTKPTVNTENFRRSMGNQIATVSDFLKKNILTTLAPARIRILTKNR